MLDTGSQISLVADTFVRRFSVPVEPVEDKVSISGIGGSSFTPKYSCSMVISSRSSKFEMSVEADVISKITYKAPIALLNSLKEQFSNFKFADNGLDQRTDVDVILGSDCLDQIFSENSQTVRYKSIALKESLFGFVVSGVPDMNTKARSTKVLSCNYSAFEIEDFIKRFWEIEEIPNEDKLSFEAQKCVEHFEHTVRRNSENRFVVKLPVKGDVSKLSNNKSVAVKSLLHAEKKLSAEMKEEYDDFLREYLSLGHMREIDPSTLKHSYRIPHRAVLRPSSSTTQLRVVFNASSRYKGGLSLNDILMSGPRVQPDLFDILVNFRSYQFVFKADIEKMYRQVLVDEEDQKLQCILWKPATENNINAYLLCTVTYGTVPGSFLATYCLEVLGRELEGSNYQAGRAIRTQFYMDDLLTGTDDETQLIDLQKAIHSKLLESKFKLRKYSSNSPKLLNTLPENLLEKGSSVSIAEEDFVNTLGIKWNTSSDRIEISINPPPVSSEVTKREALSFIAKQFDPLGLLMPVTIRGKMFLQESWRLGLGWDDPMPEDLVSKFRDYQSDVCALKDYSISRHIGTLSVERKLVGFCDASPSAYCAVVYAVTAKNTLSLVCSKTRVAPLKSLTVPRLELQGALLLAQILVRVAKILQVKENDIFAFTDSSIVLSWLNKPIVQTEVFVRNRSSKIVSMVSAKHWYHVRTKFNPADLATRGLSFESFKKEEEKWFKGPDWSNLNLLSESVITPQDLEVALEVGPDSDDLTFVSYSATTEKNVLIELTEKISSYSRLLAIVARILRFPRSTRKGRYKKVVNSFTISSDERSDALKCILRCLQSVYFQDILEDLSNHKNVKRLKSLSLFIDQDDIVRVGGRLENSAYSYDKKHPYLVSAKSHFFQTWVRHVHLKYFHASRNFVMSFVRDVFWPVHGCNRIVKSVLQGCVTCRRIAATTYSQIMGQLPPDRLKISRPFTVIGVDFAGPFTTKCTAHRSLKFNKSYLAVFVCFSVRAIHIEVVSDLTTAGFIAALRRFAGRRGVPSRIYSDNATNFVGASRLLINGNEEIELYASKEGIEWKFIPPRTPNQGGLWEAAVKSVKTHLTKISLGTEFTFEELSTITAEIEAMLNDRPLGYKEDGSNGVTVLTPSSFLVGSKLNQVDMPEITEISLSRRWREKQRIVRTFWGKWRNEFLSQLQHKVKWTQSKVGPNVGDVVLLKEDHVAPSNYPYGRITKLFADQDGKTRSVELKTPTGEKVRPIRKLVYLPIDGICSDAPSAPGSVFNR